MIGVDGRARFLDCLPLDAAQIQECIDQAVQDPEKRKDPADQGAVDVSYPVPDLGTLRVNAFHSRTKLAAVMRRIITNPHL